MAISLNQTQAQAMPTIDAGVSHEMAKWRAANYSDVRYKLNLTLEKMSPTLKGTIEISLQNNADLIVLDWRKIRGKEDSSKISNLSVNGRPAYFEEINEHLVLKEGVLKGKPNIIKLDFTSPIATSGTAITRYVDKEDGAEYVYSLFVPSDASTVFPVFDQPDLKARFQLSVHAPKHWIVISNSFREAVLSKTQKEAEDKFNGNVEQDFIFNETRPISTYVFAFAAGEFSQFSEEVEKQLIENRKRDDDSIIFVNFAHYSGDFSHIYVRKSQAEKFKAHEKEVFRLNREGVKFLESYFDYKFPFPKYDLVLLPEFPFGGMEHAGCTFLREDRVIFPTEPTKNDYITRANVIFHEAAHQWFGDTVTMRWFDDLWLKEGFAEFMAYKTMEKVLPQYNAWKAFYERNKPLAYLTDSTRGTTPIYQEIPNLSAAKSAYGNIVYRKAPAFLRQAEFYLGEDKFQIAARAFLKQNAFKNAEWLDLVKSFEAATGRDLKTWANTWVKRRGAPIVQINLDERHEYIRGYSGHDTEITVNLKQKDALNEGGVWPMRLNLLFLYDDARGKEVWRREIKEAELNGIRIYGGGPSGRIRGGWPPPFIFPNYQDYGYGIFLLDARSRDYVLSNIQNEKDDFSRAMMWGTLWDSVRETELDPKDYVELAIKNISGEKDELTVQTISAHVSTAMNYYLSEKQQTELAARLEKVLLERMSKAETLGLRITFYRAFLNVASTEESRKSLKEILTGKAEIKDLKLKTKDKFDIVTRLLILNDQDAPKLLEDLAKTETSDEAKRYFYAARAGKGMAENKREFWNDFVSNKELSESYIESAFVPFNSVQHANLTLPYLEKALAELANLKRSRKIFFINGWLAAFIGGQRDDSALKIINDFLTNNPKLDKDLQLKILEAADNLERSIKIRHLFAGKES